MFEADCCNGIVAAATDIIVSFWAESTGGGDKAGKEDVEGSEAAIDAGGLRASDGAD